jgi:predicted transport protein
VKAEDVRLVQLLDGAKQFVVPVFQRDYSWETKHCLQLWNDIMQAGATPLVQAHFVGSLVYIAAEENNARISRWLLIDGQQRLTTIILLLTAVRDLLVADPEASTSSAIPTADEVSDYYLINRHARGAERHKLQLRRTDHTSLAALLDGGERPKILAERVMENFAFFQEKVAEADLQQLLAGIKKLVAVQVVLLRGQDDPQLIFESLNSTGLELAQADLIRNFVLMRQEEHVQSKLYNDFWRPMEVEFDARYRSDFDKFVRDYLTLCLQPSKPLRIADIYKIFREYFYKQGGEPAATQILEDLRQHAKYYVSYTTANHKEANVSRAFRNLRVLVDVAAPVVMRLLHAHEVAGTLSTAELIEAAELLESYVFRRSVCELETRSLGRIFASFAFEVEEKKPLHSLKIAIALQSHNRRFPDDAEFKSALETRNVYSMRQCHYLLDRLENDSKERIDTSDFTIEHILPQNPRLPKEWRTMLGDAWKEIQETWVHRLGNITLTGYNSEYSDRPFDRKLSVEGGFADSPLRLNKFVKNQAKWTESEIEKRGKLLGSSALKIWAPMQIDGDALRKARLHRMREEASGYSEQSLSLDDVTKVLFGLMRTEILAIGADVAEIFRAKSVTYRVFDYFVEVIPRKQHLTLLFNIDFEECDDPSLQARDASNKAFIINASEEGGVILQIWSEGDFPAALHILKQAYDQVVD